MLKHKRCLTMPICLFAYDPSAGSGCYASVHDSREDIVRNINEPVHPGARPNEAAGRAVGVILIAVVCFLFAVAMVSVVVRTAMGAGDPATPADAVLSLPWLLLAIALIPICTMSGIGLLLRRHWARYLVVGGMVVAIVGLFIRSLGMPSLDYGLRNAFTGSLLPVAIILYLLHPSIRAGFQR